MTGWWPLLPVLLLAAAASRRVSRVLPLGLGLPGACTLWLAIFCAAFLWPGTLGLVTGRALMGPWPVALTALAVTAALAWAARERRRAPPRGPWRGADRFAVAALALSGLLLAIGFPRGFEITAYHLPVGLHMLQSHALTVWDHAYMHAFPAASSLWSAFWLAVLPERLVSLSNLPFAALVYVVADALARQVGSPRHVAGWLALGVFSLPIFGFAAFELGSDLAGVAAVGATLLFAAARPRSLALAALAGVAAGLAFGFKTTHLVAAVWAGAMVLFAPGRDGRRPDWSGAAVFIAGFAALALPWLLRNAITFGNPLYPVHLGAAFDALGLARAPDFDVAARASNQYEWVRRSAEWLVNPWTEWHFLGQNWKSSAGTGAFFAAVVPVAWVAWALLGANALRSRLQSGERPAAAVAAALQHWGYATLVVAVWFALGDRQPRYMMSAIVPLVALYGPLLGTAAGAAVTASAPRWQAIGLRLLQGTALAMLALLLVLFAWQQLGYLRGGRLPERWKVYEVMPELDTLPATAVVGALAPRPMHYALYGARLDHRVVPRTELDAYATAPGAWRFDARTVQALGLTHLFMDGNKVPRAEGCAELHEVAALERNPFNNVPLPQPWRLYTVRIACPDGAVAVSTTHYEADQPLGPAAEPR